MCVVDKDQAKNLETAPFRARFFLKHDSTKSRANNENNNNNNKIKPRDTSTTSKFRAEKHKVIIEREKTTETC